MRVVIVHDSVVVRRAGRRRPRGRKSNDMLRVVIADDGRMLHQVVIRALGQAGYGGWTPEAPGERFFVAEPFPAQPFTGESCTAASFTATSFRTVLEPVPA